MNCAELDILICDYVDGTLAPAEKAEVDRHLAECRNCAELARDAATAVQFMESAAEVEPPPELITRILHDSPWKKAGVVREGTRSWLRKVLSPLVQPKFAMGMAMTILSFSLLKPFVAPGLRQLKPEDLKPSAVWASIDDQAHRAWARTVKYYENLKVVYQIQTMLREWQQQDDEQPAATPGNNRKTDDRKLPVKTSPAQIAEPDLKNSGGAPAPANTGKPPGGSR
jgi:hypothetical protein